MTVAPPSIALAPGQDTGSSSSDGITNRRTLQITGTATPGDTVVLFIDVNKDGLADYPDVALYYVVADSNGNFTAPIVLNDGSYAIAAVETDGTSISAVSQEISLTVDSVAPTVAAITLPDPPTTGAANVHFVVSFSEPITTPIASDFSLKTTGAILGAAIVGITPVAGSQGASYVVDVATGNGNGSIALDVIGTSIKDIAGNPFSGLFRAGSTYAAGIGPSAVTVTDVNNDHIPDLVVADLFSSTRNADGSFGPGSLTVLLGNGDGTFQAPQIVPTGAGPYATEAADLNHDGNTDLVVLNAYAGFRTGGNTDGSVSVLYGDGTGHFTAGPTYTVGLDPEAMAMGDLNHDGQPDIVVANADDNSVSVLLGSAVGTFNNGANYATGLGPNGITLGDINNDGNLDIITTNNFDNTLSILEGNGDGTFRPAISVPVGTIPNDVAMADLNGDGKPDLVVANWADNDVQVLLGNGDGTFQQPVAYATGANAYSVAIQDMNGDGIPDILVSDASTAEMTLLLGNGNGTFRPPETFATGDFPASFAVADLNGDGLPDVVVPNYQDATLSVLLNRSAANLSSAYQVQRSPGAGAIAGHTVARTMTTLFST